MLTPLVFLEFHCISYTQLVCIDLRVKAIERLQNHGKVAGAQIYRAPRSHGLSGVDGLIYVLEMLLAKAPDGFALCSRVSN